MTIQDLLHDEQEEGWDWYEVVKNVLGGVFITAVLYALTVIFFCL